MAKQQLTADEESILKRQARRRLIGALALTSAIVVILPMVFDGEPTSNTLNDIELRIPDKDKVGEFLPNSAVLPAAVSAVTNVTVPMSAPVAAPTAASAVNVTAIAATAAAAVPLLAKMDAAGQAKAESKVEAALPKAEVAKAKVEAVKPKVEAVKPKTETQSATHAHALPVSGFVVQIGAFSNADSAKKMQEKLTKQGLHAYTEKVGSNVRVRVGGFATHEAADKVRHRLESQGLHPNVVALAG